jgi:hypothetical protein
MSPSADQQPLGHRKAREAGLLARLVEIAHQVGEYDG